MVASGGGGSASNNAEQSGIQPGQTLRSRCNCTSNTSEASSEWSSSTDRLRRFPPLFPGFPSSLRFVLLASFSARWSSFLVTVSASLLPLQTTQHRKKKTTKKKTPDRQKSRTVSGSDEIHFQCSPKATLRGEEQIKVMKNFISNCVFFLQTAFFLRVGESLLVSPLAPTCESVCALLSAWAGFVLPCATLFSFFTSGCQ